MSKEIDESIAKKEKILNWRSFGISCLIIAFGSSLLLFDVTDDMICKYMSIVLVLAGLVYVVSYFSRNIGEVFHENDLTFGLLGIISGCVVYLRRDDLSTMVHAFVGLILVTNALFKLQHAIDMKRMDIKLKQIKQMWLVVIIFSLLVLSAGLVIVLFSDLGETVFRCLSGTMFIVAGITDIITQIGFVRKLKSFRNVVNVQAGMDFMEQNARNIAEAKGQDESSLTYEGKDSDSATEASQSNPDSATGEETVENDSEIIQETNEPY